MSVRRLLVATLCCSCIVTVGYVALYWHTRSNITLSLKRAQRYLELQQLDSAQNELDWIFWVDVTNVDAAWLKALCQIESGQLSEAIDVANRVPGSHAGFVRLQVTLITALLADYRMEQAESVLRRFLTEQPHSVGVRHQLAGLLNAQGRNYAARKVWRGFLQGGHYSACDTVELVKALRESARTHFEHTDAERNLPMLQESLRRHPEQQTVQCAVAYWSWQSGETDDARRIFDSLIREDVPDSVLWTAAEFFCDEREGERAEDLLDRVSATDSEELQIILSKLQEMTRHFSQAFESVEQAIDLSTPSAELSARKARFAQRMGQAAEAKEYYSESHRLADAELKLWKLTRSMPEVPSIETCETAARLYGSMDAADHQDAWNELKRRLEQAAAGEGTE